MTNSLQVLLVEDNEADAFLTTELLRESDASVSVECARDGAAALEELGRRESVGEALPDLILLDLNMPRLDGHGFLERVKRAPGLRRIPAVVFSSSDARRDVVESYERGAACYVTKPVGLDEMSLAIESIVSLWLRVARLP